MPVLLPEASADRRDAIIARLLERGVSVAKYFSPHLAEQIYFRQSCVISDLPITDAISQRILSLPLFDRMSANDVRRVCDALLETEGAP